MGDTQTQGQAREFFATCPKGFEQLLAGELRSLGAEGVRSLHGQVAFSGSLEAAYRACLWSRIASRIVLVIAHAGAANADELYESLYELPWENHVALTSTFAVDAHGMNDELRNTQFIALRAKDAICDRLQAKLGARPSVEVRNPDVTVVVRVRNNRLTCGIDLSGDPLFRRGTTRRAENDGLGGMRPDYAAAMLAAGAWHRAVRHGSPTLVAAFSGSGTLVSEAAGIALDRAPGLLRSRWGFTGWLGHDAQAWDTLLDEAGERAARGAEKAGELSLIAVDPRRGSASAANAALRASGIDAKVTHLSGADGVANALSDAEADRTLATIDLSWLEPDEPAREVEAIALATTVADALPAGAGIVTLSQGPTLGAALSLALTDSLETFLGRDAATITSYEAGRALAGDDTEAPAPAAARATVTLKDGTKVPVLVPQSDQFAARLAKVAKLRAKWARREDVSCYRVYDADLPDYAVAIDLYEASEQSRGADAHARWLVVQEYAAPKDINHELAHRRLLDVLAIAPRVMGVDAGNVTLRVRRRAKGGSQYANEGKAEERRSRRDRLALAPGAHLVDEGGLTFEVNLAERLDTGLFLDHRDVRARVREMAKETQGSKRFLNLFAYTGTATCYAADGGAKNTTTVDLSRTYLDWAERNMERNGFTGREHEFVQADVVRWVTEQRHTYNRWDLVFCDPPTFSNSKRMGHDVFDVQRDHAELLIGISRLLTANGVCLFSCNLRGFEPDVEKLARAGVEIHDVTEGTIPEDFKRNAKIHHVYLVKRTPRPEASAAPAAPARAEGTPQNSPARTGERRGGYGSRDERSRYGSGSRDDRGGRGGYGSRGGHGSRSGRNDRTGRPYGSAPRNDRPRYDDARPDGPRPHTVRSQGPMRPLMGNGPRPSQHAGSAARPRLQGNGPRPSQFGDGRGPGNSHGHANSHGHGSGRGTGRPGGSRSGNDNRR
uniref:bifunctional 23S rRNA (guanine(2069)-N(7))-methyltransferase RlmK/23S rRNA (guanine(2445)-N(2))-methyltransferase RlmL n=1 Tax=Parolsenella massiliensis TaxID=1871022 RepID=UPI000932B4C7|nr:bifunctional 23S rRNA (guanine(2069)-N(7))-methyltransferase RlmK/23S rRNA (guanine(2445)-N(2))-methyltransferase RlmL [Parolsenella massiliensis]